MEELIKRQLAIEERLDQLQVAQEKDNNWISRLSRSGGLIALALSIILGGFTLWDNLFLSSDREVRAQISRLGSLVREISRANSDARSLALSGQAEAAQVLNTLKMPLIESAIEIVEKQPDKISPSTLMALSYELANLGDFELAGRYASFAAERFSIPHLRIEALRQKAISEFSSLRPELIVSGRSEFSQLVQDSGRLQGMQKYWVISNTIRDWISAEAMIGECQKARDVADAYLPMLAEADSRYEAASGLASAFLMIEAQALCPTESYAHIVSQVDPRLAYLFAPNAKSFR